jgi:hypothetical protein
MSVIATMSDDHSLNFSDEEEEIDNGYHPPELQGTLSKWTNFFHGWQSRFIVLRDGTLSYYKSEQDTGFGCRGAISLFKAAIKVCYIQYVSHVSHNHRDNPPSINNPRLMSFGFWSFSFILYLHQLYFTVYDL